MSPEVLAADIAQHGVAPTTPLGRDLVARTRRPSSPPVPIAASRPLAGASRQHLVVEAFELRSVETPSARRRRATSTAAVLNWLSGYAGRDWPERWASSGAETRGRDWSPRTGDDRGQMTQGLATLLCLRVLRPGYRWLLGERFLGLWSLFGEVNDPAGFTRLNELSHRYDPHAAAEAVHALIRVMVHTGKPIAALEPADLLAYVEVVTATKRPNAMHVAWLLLHDIGVLDDNVPASLHAARGRGQRSVVDMVDSYEPASRAVRDVFVDYLTERSASLDYSSLRVLSSRLVGVFWCDIERLAPGIGTLRLDPVLARRWKQDLNTLQRGGPRLDADAVLMSVRAFYADIAQWALAEPHIWAQWAAPNPVNGADLRGYAKHVRRREGRMHHRTRTLAPVLSALSAATHARLSAAQGLLAAAERAGEGEQFAFAERPWRRLRRSRTGAHRPYSQVRVIDTDGAVLDVTTEEADAFWAWAIIEVLRLTGLFSRGPAVRGMASGHVCAGRTRPVLGRRAQQLWCMPARDLSRGWER